MNQFLSPISVLILVLALLIGVSVTWLFDTGPRNALRTSERARVVAQNRKPRQVIGAVSLFGVGVLTGGVIFGSYVIAAPFAFLLSATPSLIAGARDRRNANAFTQSWPDAIDHLSSAIRAGLNLSESLAAIGLRGPAPLRPYFIALGNDLAGGTPLESALARFCAECDDPIADQLVETVLIAHEVGGSEIGRLLRTFSQFLRLDIQTRDEIRVRQGWVVNGARIAAAAPWILLALLSLRHESVSAYQSAGGIFVIFIGAILSVVAYLWMCRLGRLGVVTE
jgi:tight adherence protein B